MVDKNGKRIREFDLLKVFHFTGARKKKNYMYKWVLADTHTGDLMGNSLNYNGHHFNLYSIADENGVIASAEIIQRGGPSSEWED